jgi:hypothetical protein
MTQDDLSTGGRPNRGINWWRVAELFFAIILIYVCLGLCLMPGIRT